MGKCPWGMCLNDDDDNDDDECYYDHKCSECGAKEPLNGKACGLCNEACEECCPFGICKNCGGHKEGTDYGDECEECHGSCPECEEFPDDDLHIAGQPCSNCLKMKKQKIDE